MSSVLRQHHVETNDQALLSAIEARTATVAVVGLGYVGLPLLLDTSRAGFPGIGVDVNAERIQSLTAARSYLSDVSDDDVRELRAVSLSSDPLAVSDADVVLIAVPTPLTNGVPDLSMVEGSEPGGGDRPASRDAGRSWSRRRIRGPPRRSSGPSWRARAWSPATTSSSAIPRADRPRQRPSDGRYAKIVSGVGPEATDLVQSFYAQLVNRSCGCPRLARPRWPSSSRTRSVTVNIALVNEMTMIAPHLGDRHLGRR